MLTMQTKTLKGMLLNHTYRLILLCSALGAYHAKRQSQQSAPALHQVSQGPSHQAVPCAIGVHDSSWDSWQVLSGHMGARGMKGAEGRTLRAHCQDHMLHACLQQVEPLKSVREAQGVSAFKGGGRGRGLHVCVQKAWCRCQQCG